MLAQHGTARSSRISRWLRARLQSARRPVSTETQGSVQGAWQHHLGSNFSLNTGHSGPESRSDPAGDSQNSQQSWNERPVCQQRPVLFPVHCGPPLPKVEDAVKLHPDPLLDGACLTAGITAPLSFSSDPLFRELPKSPIKSFLIPGAKQSLQLPGGSS